MKPAKAVKVNTVKDNRYLKVIAATRAMPIRPPNCCKVFKIPEALPDFSVGAEPKIAAKITVIKTPLPAEIKTMPGSINLKYETLGFTKVKTAMPAKIKPLAK